MAVVITNRICRTDVGDPAGLYQRNQPGKVLARNSDGSCDRDRERAARSDRVIEDRVDTPQVRAAEGRKAVGKNIVEGDAFVHALHLYLPSAGFCR